MIKYPAAIDTEIELPRVVDNVTPINGNVINNLRDAIVAVESELGIKPSGIYSNVRSRINALEITVSNITGITFGGDLAEDTSVTQTVVGLQGREVSSAAPSDGYLLTWEASTSQWKPSAPIIEFTAGGDLSGTPTSQTVVSLTGIAGVVTGPSTAITIGSTPSTTGTFRLPNNFTIKARNAANNLDLTAIAVNGSDFIVIGSTTGLAGSMIVSPADLFIRSGVTYFENTAGSIARGLNTDEGWQFFASSEDLGGGANVIGIKNASTNPITNPTNGIIVYVDAADGFLKYRTDSGDVISLDGVGFSAGGDLTGTSTSQSVVSLTGVGSIVSVPSASFNFGASGHATEGYFRFPNSAGYEFVKRNSTSDGNIALVHSFGDEVYIGSAHDSSRAADAVNVLVPLVLGDTYLSIGTSPSGAGLIRIPHDGGADQIIIGGRAGVGNDQPILRAIGSFTIRLGHEDEWDSELYGADTVIWGKTTGNFVAGASALPIANWSSSDGFDLIKVAQTGYLSLGTAPASQGIIRLANNTALYGRNAADTDDLKMLFVDASSRVCIGEAAVNKSQIIVGTDASWISQSGEMILRVFNTQPIKIDAGTSSTVQLLTGSNLEMSVSSSAVTLYNSALTYDTTVSAPIFSQSDNTTNSATAATLTIQSQNATGTTANGGDLDLKSGTGTSTHGDINILASGGTGVGGNVNITSGASDMYGANVNISTGSGGSFAGAVRIKAGTETLVEALQFHSTRRIVALARGSDLTTTQMPANTGDRVVYLADAATAPTANPVSGSIIYSNSGNVTVREPSGRIIPIEPIAASEAGGRLTLTSATPVTTSDVASSSTIYYTAYTSGRIALYTGTIWRMYSFTESSLALSGLTSDKNYDVFAYASGSTVTLELSAAWTTNTSRSTAITRQDGVLVKSGDATRRFIGTIRTISTTTTTDTVAQRFVWNLNNRIPRYLYVQDTTASWTYNSATWRQIRATTSNKVEAVFGDPDHVSGSSFLMWNGASGTGIAMYTSIGIDSTTVPLATVTSMLMPTAPAQYWWPSSSELDSYVSEGYHAFNWLESAHATTITGMGTVGLSQSHMRVRGQF
jgi:hypothetical protein